MKYASAAPMAALLLVLATAHPASALTLGEGLRKVAASGIDVRRASHEGGAALEAEAIARAAYLPEVGIYARHTWLEHEPQAEPSPGMTISLSEDSFLSYGVTARQTLYDFGRSGSALDAARAGSLAAGRSAETVRNAAARDFIIAYFSLLEAGSLGLSAEEDVRRLEAHHKDASSLFEEGMVTLNETLAAEVALSEARLALMSAHDAVSLRRARLNSMLERPLGDPLEAEEPALDLPPLPLEPEASEEALAARPELHALAARIEAKAAEAGAARAAHLPVLYVQGGYAYEENKYMVYDDNWSLSAGAEMSLFEGGRTRARVRKALAELAAMKEDLAHLREAVLLEVEEARLRLLSARERVDVSERASGQARENLRIEELRYEEGEETETGVRDAIDLMARAEYNYYTSYYGLRKAQALLLYALGRDLAALYGPTGESPTEGKR